MSRRDASAVIVRAHLPPALEALRRAWVADAHRGLPAHLTLLSPFVRAGELDATVRRRLAMVIARHYAFDYHLVGPKVSPDTIYAGVDSERPFLELHRDLAAEFPDYPIYDGKGGELVPHVTVASGHSALRDRGLIKDRAWHSLPTRRRAHSIEVIAPGPDGRWATVWRFRLPTID